MADQRTYTAGRFMLDVNGVNVGFVKKFSGLAMEADIATNDLATDLVQKKHVANIKWTPAKATIGIGMGKEMYQWIRSAFEKGYETRSGSVVAGDFNYKAQSRLNFMNGLITSVTVPKLDGASKDAAYFDVEWECEQVRWEKGDNSDIRGKIGPKQKAWLCSNFRVEIGNLPCSRVATVDSFTWKCAVASDQIGIFREPTKHPAKVTVPELKLGISMADFDPWAQAAKKWFVDGHHEEADEMTGRIVFLGPDMQKELGSIELLNLGFKKFNRPDYESNSEKIARFDVELYCEAMKFQIDYSDAGA
jgi:hypothetical protein